MAKTVSNSRRQLHFQNEPKIIISKKDSKYLVTDMLATTISCMMLMATRSSKIPEEYLICAQSYLECIKNEKKTHPPNITAILTYIKDYRRNKSLCKSKYAMGDNLFNRNKNSTKVNLPKFSMIQNKTKKPRTQNNKKGSGDVSGSLLTSKKLS